MNLGRLTNNRIIIKTMVRAANGTYIGTMENTGIVEEVSESICVRIDEGRFSGQLWEIPCEKAFVSSADFDRYELGGTGPWSEHEFVLVEDAAAILEWEIWQSAGEKQTDDAGRKDTKPKSDNTESIRSDNNSKEVILKEAENSDDRPRVQKESKYEKTLKPLKMLPSGNYSVQRFDSIKEYNRISPVTKEEFETEEEAHEVMADAARAFIRSVKRGGNLIDIKKLSQNSVRVEYVDRSGRDAYVIFQVFATGA